MMTMYLRCLRKIKSELLNTVCILMLLLNVLSFHCFIVSESNIFAKQKIMIEK